MKSHLIFWSVVLTFIGLMWPMEHFYPDVAINLYRVAFGFTIGRVAMLVGGDICQARADRRG